jgi:hypothetical protein
MILKLKINNDDFDTVDNNSWKFYDNISRINSYQVKEEPKDIRGKAVTIKGDGVSNGPSLKAYNCLFLDCRHGSEDLAVYTELPAFLLNDKGETIERLN